MLNIFLLVKSKKTDFGLIFEYFLIDEQTCELRFSTSGFNASQVRFGWYATANSMELSDYAPSGTWTLIGAPAEIRIVNSTEPPYESRTEIVFFMSKYSFFLFSHLFFFHFHIISYSTTIFILYNQFNYTYNDDISFNSYFILFTK